jgi:hypothetical protein
MTSAGSDPPGLPPGDDPYELLGVAPDASERDIRKAYAKRIKVYRPDRAPAEFQRIQRAFELLSSGMIAADSEPAREPAPPAEALDPAVAEERERSISAQLAEAFAAYSAGDRATADRIVGELLGQRAPLERMLRDPDYRPMILDSPAIRWSNLDDRDPEGRWAVWMQAFARACEHDPARMCALIDDDALRLDAADHPALAVNLLLWLGAACWKSEVSVQEILGRYRKQLPPHPAVDDALERAELDRTASAALRGKYLPPVVRPLLPLLIAARSGSPDEQRTWARELVNSLAVDVQMSLDQLDGMITEQVEVYAAIEQVIAHDLPARRRKLDGLSKRRFAHLTRKLHTAGKRERSLFAPVFGFSVVLGLIAAVVPPLAVVVAIMTGAYLMVGESGRYKREIRQRLALAILASPVDSITVSRWVKLNRKLNGRLGRFDIAIDNDHGLYLFSFLASYAAEVGDLDERLDRDD